MADLLDLALDGVAAGRLTRLIVADEISRPLRDWVIATSYPPERRRELIDLAPFDSWAERVLDDPNPPRLGYVFACPWCMGLWCAAVALLGRRLAPRWWPRAARLLVAAELAGRLASS